MGKHILSSIFRRLWSARSS
uniref:Uncharacterized protein n=1 Tax=Timema cristinae TaxID=61476 RepID=A0A7R9HEG5_TIMCR|nr:unnamed protein product [Timema cristinae]